MKETYKIKTRSRQWVKFFSGTYAHQTAYQVWGEYQEKAEVVSSVLSPLTYLSPDFYCNEDLSHAREHHYTSCPIFNPLTRVVPNRPVGCQAEIMVYLPCNLF